MVLRTRRQSLLLYIKFQRSFILAFHWTQPYHVKLKKFHRILGTQWIFLNTFIHELITEIVVSNGDIKNIEDIDLRIPIIFLDKYQ